VEHVAISMENLIVEGDGEGKEKTLALTLTLTPHPHTLEQSVDTIYLVVLW